MLPLPLSPRTAPTHMVQTQPPIDSPKLADPEEKTQEGTLMEDITRLPLPRARPINGAELYMPQIQLRQRAAYSSGKQKIAYWADI
jgi:hypothetical protein